MKAIEIKNVFLLLNSAKVTKMEDPDKYKVIKAAIAMKSIAMALTGDTNDAREKLMDDEFKLMQRRANKWRAEYGSIPVNERTPEVIQELNIINTYFYQYEQKVSECMREEEDKEHELQFEKLSESAFEKLIASNDWTVSEIVLLNDILV